MDESAADIVISIRQQLDALPVANPSFTIFRIPSHYRESNKLQFEPQMVSIGPYHYDHRRGRLRFMEQHKWRCLNNLLSQQPNTTLEEYVKATKALEGRARQCYVEHMDLPSHKFVEMLLLDACFILDFTIKWQDHDAMFDAMWSPFIRNDLLMMENQIPFFILHSLFRLLEPQSNLQALINRISPCLMGYSKFKPPPINLSTEVCHLLHLYYSYYISTMIIPSTSDRSEIHSSPSTIPCASELKNGGVKFMVNKFTVGFVDVRFSKGTMKIPRLSIDSSTQADLMNLVVYERCNSPWVTKKLSNYVYFMDCLINTTDDIAVLEECGIIENLMPSREAAALLFNQISDCAFFDWETNYLAGLYIDVNHYYEKKWHRTRAMLMRDYFSNPWTVISVVAAIILFILTFLQTFYAMFSYHHPLKN